eukprot:1162093-Pelagomonas_calceolata.AAC.8
MLIHRESRLKQPGQIHHNHAPLLSSPLLTLRKPRHFNLTHCSSLKTAAYKREDVRNSAAIQRQVAQPHASAGCRDREVRIHNAQEAGERRTHPQQQNGTRSKHMVQSGVPPVQQQQQQQRHQPGLSAAQVHLQCESVKRALEYPYVRCVALLYNVIFGLPLLASEGHEKYALMKQLSGSD